MEKAFKIKMNNGSIATVKPNKNCGGYNCTINNTMFITTSNLYTIEEVYKHISDRDIIITPSKEKVS